MLAASLGALGVVAGTPAVRGGGWLESSKGLHLRASGRGGGKRVAGGEGWGW